MKKHYEKTTTSLHQGTLGQPELEAEIDDALDDEETAKDETKGHKKSKVAKASSESMGSSLGYVSQVRKRQAISHAFCLERFLRQSLKPEDLRELMGALEKVSMKQTILQQIRANVEKDCGILRYEVGLQQLEQRKETMFGKYFDMKTLLNLTMGESLLRGGTCLLCQKPPADPTYAEVVSETTELCCYTLFVLIITVWTRLLRQMFMQSRQGQPSRRPKNGKQNLYVMLLGYHL